MDTNSQKLQQEIAKLVPVLSPYYLAEQSDATPAVKTAYNELQRLCRQNRDNFTVVWDQMRANEPDNVVLKNIDPTELDLPQNGQKGGSQERIGEEMRADIEQKLRSVVQAKSMGNPLPEVDDHNFYEAQIEYAIRNGTMSVADKVYYLVQGIAHRIISLDVLNRLRHDREKLLNVFPVIAYFDDTMSTQEAIESLAAQLRESSDADHENDCKPGMKTMLWVERNLTSTK